MSGTKRCVLELWQGPCALEAQHQEKRTSGKDAYKARLADLDGRCEEAL